jgi:diadenosine tetraphosphate (Ap4A) HIT family hydrolase
MSDTNCKICTMVLPSPYLVHENDLWRIRHSNETDIEHYCIIESKRHFLDLSNARADELAEYAALLSKLMSAQRKLIPNCERIYTFSLAEAVPHFHVHVIPRRDDFPADYIGRGIMSYPLSPALDFDRVGALVSALRAHF